MGSSSLTKDKPGSSALGVQSLSPWTTRKVPSLLHFDILCMSVWPPPLYYFLYSSANAGDVRDVDLIPGLGRSAGGGHGNPLQYSCLENPMDRGIWRAIIYRVTELDMTEHAAHTDWTTYQVSLSFTVSWSFSDSYPLSQLKRIFWYYLLLFLPFLWVGFFLILLKISNQSLFSLEMVYRMV